MENIKFYNVEIGTRTRAGNLNVIHHFVAQSESSQNNVYGFYSNKYLGFSVNVNEIKEIVKDDIPEIRTETYNFQSSPLEKEKKELEKQVKELSKGFEYFQGTVTYNSMSAEITLALKELEKLDDSYKTLKYKINKNIKSFLEDKYKLLYREVTLGEYTHDTVEIGFTIRLKGKMKPINNKL